MYPTKYNTERPNQQHCPTCNAYVKFSPRYPNYICQRCCKKITDKQKRPLEFVSTSKVGRRAQGVYPDNHEAYHGVYCYLTGVKLRAEEDSLGRIIISPIKARKGTPVANVTSN